MEIKEALSKIRKEKERKFDQSVDLIVNLKGIDVKRDNVNVVVALPHKLKDKRVCAFLKDKSKIVPTITELEFIKYKDKKELQKLVKQYDYFISIVPLMPKVAAVFGKVLGPVGKMPSPQLGLLMQENDDEINKALVKIATSLKIRMKQASIKVLIGKASMDDESIIENLKEIYGAIENALPKKRENVKNVLIKFTMGKPVKVEVK